VEIKLYSTNQKGEQAVCLVCNEKINTFAYLNNLVKFSCPSCSCELSADKNAESFTCTLCETQIDVIAVDNIRDIITDIEKKKK